MINADPAEIEHVVLSLAVNARNAMAKGGKLTVSTKLVDVNEEFHRYRRRRADRGICDALRSTTLAMARIAEPVSSHDQDTRINLSLAAVRGVVKNAGGYVRLSTEPGKGNSFNIYFPPLKQDTQEDSQAQFSTKCARRPDHSGC